MTVVPFRPIAPQVLKDITRLKLKKLANRLQISHRLAVDFEPALVDELAARCTDPGSGARNVDHILRSSLMPELARAILERLADDAMTARLTIKLDGKGSWAFDFDGAPEEKKEEVAAPAAPERDPDEPAILGSDAG